MEFRAATQNRSLCGNWRGRAADQYGSSRRNLTCELHSDRRDRAAFSSWKVQLERGSALYAHFQCRLIHSESGHQYDSGTAGRWAFLAIAIVAKLKPGETLAGCSTS